jgi:hypothetical protein
MIFMLSARSMHPFISFFFRKPPADPYKAVANGNGKKKPGNKENYWIKQDQMELEPCVKKDEGIASTIPRYCYKKNNH